ncbi:MAG: signal peptidase I [Verrucomicrobiota bacterium]|nr:signal peptidase I [Verrucomicrobiota bacterium]
MPLWVRLVVGRNPGLTLIRTAIWILASIILFKFVLVPIRVKGNSMHPTYRDGRINVINRYSYYRAKPKRGDVVGVTLSGNNLLLLKRIVGLPGETISVREGRFFINGELLEEPYANGLIPWTFRGGEVQLKADQYLVIGDNRPLSSTHLKFENEILGKVLF